MADVFELYCFAQSGNAYKAALMLALCEADWEARWVDYLNGETRKADYRETVNEMGEVPVLSHDGVNLSQSGVILDYLAGHFGKFGWESETERREIMRWLFWDNHKLTSYTATYRFLCTYTPTKSDPAVTDFLGGRMRAAFEILNGHLAERRFVIGARPTIADLSLCGYLFWPDEFGVDWTDYPHIGAWLGRIRALPNWAHPYDLMPGHPLPEAN